MNRNNFLDETKKSAIEIHSALGPFYGRVDYANLRGHCSYDAGTSLRFHIPAFEERINAEVERLKASEQNPGVFSHHLVFELFGSSSQGIITKWFPDGNITFLSYKEFDCENSEEAITRVKDYVSGLPQSRLEAMERHYRLDVLEGVHYRNMMEMLIAVAHGDPSQINDYFTPEEISFALELEKRLKKLK